jgi:UDP-N-acetylglucosamine 2-epimerase (non-hydrolysing)
MKIVLVIGTRPEAIKMAPVVKALEAAPWARTHVLLTGQHAALLESALSDFGLHGDANLQLMSAGQTLSQLTGRAFLQLEGALKDAAPDLVLAQGDTTTVMATAVTCFYMGVRFGHVEAGLRTGDLRSPFPEEFNRVIAGKLSDFHFAPTKSSVDALLKEGVAEDTIHLTGNTVIDALASAVGRADPGKFRPAPGRRLILLTTHRRENFGEPLRGVLRTLRRVVETTPDLEMLFPAHPNPAVTAATQAELEGAERVRVIEPLAYFDFVGAMLAADVIVTDSGGVQEEAPFLRKPVLVTRNETERPDAVDYGVAKLVGPDPVALETNLRAVLEQRPVREFMARGVSPYGDGRAADRIVQVIGHAFGHVSGGLPEPFRPESEPPPPAAVARP